MSSLWTPSGEVPLEPEHPETREKAPFEDDYDDEELEAMASEMAEVRRQLASVPASTVVANHAMGLYELAAIHLLQQPPRFDEAQLAIDAMGCLVEGVPGRLGEAEPTLRDALAQLRLTFVQVKAAGGAAPSGA